MDADETGESMTGFVWFLALATLLTGDAGLSFLCFGALALHYLA
jgi:hypothetical protein